jgi:hypothetical protein
MSQTGLTDVPPPRPKRRRRRWVPFALAAALGIGAVAFDGAVAAAAALAAMLAFVGACTHALRDEDPDSVAHSQRSTLGGWFGGGL